MKAVILLAGMGGRLAELTVSTPKSLLPIGGSNTLEHMIRKLTKWTTLPDLRWMRSRPMAIARAVQICNAVSVRPVSTR